MYGTTNLITVGGEGTLTIPVVDSRTNGMACAVIGPSTKRHGIRWFIRIPGQEDAEKISCPIGFDRKTIRFDPVVLYMDQQLPQKVTGVISSVLSGSDQSKTDRTPLHLWKPSKETGHWPAIEISLSPIAPGGIIEILGTSWWVKAWSRKKFGLLDTPDSIGPRTTQNRPISLLCLFRVGWLPIQRGKVRMQFVRGDPVFGRPASSDVDPIVAPPTAAPNPSSTPDPAAPAPIDAAPPAVEVQQPPAPIPETPGTKPNSWNRPTFRPRQKPSNDG